MRYSVGNVDVDPDAFEICVNGLPVQAEPRVLEFIFYLFRHPERLVSKHELLEHVWHTDSISESVLTRAACLARKLFGNSKLIRTVHGRGYQWAGCVLVMPSEGASPAGATAGRKRQQHAESGSSVPGSDGVDGGPPRP
jgi:DNA-binding winged helix-turn-helix (wHTH) protein